ncbi:mitotic spindle checkpoint protein MAD1 isoform X4 [Castanea sativa]|uniref:mitotic spindle checkpoint protein MAD1 isoform X4 n=1 Tax=Castanea sativa TaxID=21020 RepID=UPI003F64C9DB
MIVRTPPPKRPRSETMPPESPSAAGSDRRMVIYEDSPLAAPLHESPQQQHSDHLLCTYQCRQMVKSEFLDALSSAEKQVCDYQSRFETMNENFSKVEAERKKFLDQFLYAEQELAAATGREQALQEQLLKEVNDFQERFRKQIQSQSNLEVKLHNEMNLRMKGESSVASAEEKASVLERKLNHISESTEREKKRLHNEIEQLKRKSKLSVSRTSADWLGHRYLQEKFGGVEDAMHEDEEEQEPLWGGKKKGYYDADNADYEAQSSDDEGLLRKGEAVLKLQMQKAESYTNEDFGHDINEDWSDPSDRELTLEEMSAKRKSREKSPGIKEALDNTGAAYEEVKKDSSALSEEEQMDVLYRQNNLMGIFHPNLRSS